MDSAHPSHDAILGQYEAVLAALEEKASCNTADPTF